MKNRKNKKNGIVSTALRGGEIWRLKIKRFIKGTLWSVGISAAVGLVFSLVCIFRMEPNVFYYTQKYVGAGYRYLSGSFWSSLPVGGRQASAQQAYEAQAIMETLGSHLSGLVHSALPWGLLGLGLGFSIWLLWYKRGSRAGADEVVRGGSIVKPKELAALIKKKREVGPLQICGVPMIWDTEFRHIMLTGTTGVGKSTFLKSLLAQARTLDYRVFCFDTKGEFVEIFYRLGIDHILNPLDHRSEFFSPWADFFKQSNIDGFAASLISSEDIRSDDPFWVEAARLVVADAFRRLPTKNLEEYLNEVVRVDLERLAKIVEGTDSAAILSEDIKKTALNVRATIASRVKPLRYLWKYRPEYKPFSIRKWVNSNDPGWVFMTKSADEYKAMAPLYTVWLDTLTEAILSSSRGHKIMLILDEFPSLGKLRAIQDLMAEGRSRGVCCVIAFQNIHQLRRTYGVDGAGELAGLCNTWIAFAQPEPETAKWHSDALGKVEIDEYQEAVSYGGSRGDLRMTSTRHERPIVTPDEIMRMRRGQALLRVAEDYPITQVNTRVIDYPKIAPRYIPVDWNRTIMGPWEGHETASVGPARINPGRPDLRLLA